MQALAHLTSGGGEGMRRVVRYSVVTEGRGSRGRVVREERSGMEEWRREGEK